MLEAAQDKLDKASDNIIRLTYLGAYLHTQLHLPSDEIEDKLRPFK